MCLWRGSACCLRGLTSGDGITILRFIMPPELLVNLEEIDLNNVIFGVSDIEAANPHRYEMRHIDGIVHMDPDAGTIIGFKDVKEDEFWVRGHIPGRPLLPGVLMIEAAAQLASFFAKKLTGTDRFIGFGGIQDVKFRTQVAPGDRLYLLGKFLEVRPRRFKMSSQGMVNGQRAFEAVIVGMPI